MTRDMYWDLNTSFYISAGPYEDRVLREAFAFVFCLFRNEDSPSSESNPREGRNHDHIRRLVMPSCLTRNYSYVSYVCGGRYMLLMAQKTVRKSLTPVWRLMVFQKQFPHR